MTETYVVYCDNCNRDLTYTGNSIDYRLALLNQRLPARGDTVTDMMIYPPIERNAHFCGIQCLRAWLNKTYPVN